MSIEAIQAFAHSTPAHAAVIADGQVVTYRQFYLMVLAARTDFLKADLSGRRTALISIRSLLGAWVASLAARTMGISTIVVDNVAMLDGLDVSDVDAIIVGSAQQAAAFTQRLGLPVHVQSEPCAHHDEDNMPPEECLALTGHHFLLTSGSTGLRKRVQQRADTERERCASWARQIGYTAESVFFAANYPLYTAIGYWVPGAVWSAGGTAILEQRPGGWATAFTVPATDISLVPALVGAYLDGFAKTGGRKADFHLRVSAGFFGLETIKKLAETVTTPIEVAYGNSEQNALTLHSEFTTLDDLLWFTPTGERALAIVNESGHPCADLEQGELKIEVTDIDADSYWNDAETTASLFKDGWFYPGDMAMRRADGRIRILGRTKDVLIVGGHKIAVAPIEQKIREFLKADEVCVFARSTEAGGEELLVAVKSKRKVSQAEMQHVATRFPTFSMTRFYNLPSFPVRQGGMNKTDRQALRALLN